MKQWLSYLLSNSICMTGPALILLLLSPIITKRYMAKVRYYTWLIILAGFLFFWNPSVKIFYHIIILPNIYLDIEALTGYTEFLQELPETTYDLQSDNHHNLFAPNKNVANTMPTLEKKSQTIEKNTIEIYTIFFYLWFCGFSFILFYQIKKHQRLLRLIKHWSEPYLEIPVKKWGKEKKIFVNTCEIAIGPMLIGFFHPMIILPKKDYSKKELSFILKHEFIHYQRKDLWYKLFMLLVKSIHWFNPFLSLIFDKINQECEISCDAEVLSQADLEDKISYIETIINMIHYKNEFNSSLSTLFFHKEENIMKKRIYAIMTTKKKKIGTVIIVIALLGTILAGTSNIIFTQKEITAEETTDIKEKEEKQTISIDIMKDLLDSKEDFTSSDSVVSYDFKDHLLELSNSPTLSLDNHGLQTIVSGIARDTSLVNFVKEDTKGIGHDIGVNVITTTIVTGSSINSNSTQKVTNNISISNFYQELKHILEKKCEKLLEMDYIDTEDYLKKWEKLEEEAGKEMEEWNKKHKEKLNFFATNITFDNIWFS